MSEKFRIVERFYVTGAWNDKKVRDAVVKEWITAEEYKAITGKDY